MDSLRGIVRSGLSRGVAVGQSGATELQFSRVLPFGANMPPRASACGRVGPTQHALLVALDAKRMLEVLEVYKSAAGHLVTYSTISAEYVLALFERVNEGSDHVLASTGAVLPDTTHWTHAIPNVQHEWVLIGD
eukprot:6142661-Lingulodinium_polyedra.AAC.1